MEQIDTYFGEPAVIDEFPNSCPYCHKHLDPKYLYGFLNHGIHTNKENENEVLGVFKCTNKECCRTFLTLYLISMAEKIYLFKRFITGYPDVNVPNPVKEISPEFFEIYTQSVMAESSGLNEIDGNGYRKAVEFLARDYAKYKSPDRVESIEKAPLANVIDQNFDEDIKELFHRGTWLGGDFVHYKQFYSDFDLNDLKGIIELIMSEIEREEIKKKYLSIRKNK